MTKRASKIKMHKITNVIKIIVEIFIKKGKFHSLVLKMVQMNIKIINKKN
jgi:hypothetical protein